MEKLFNPDYLLHLCQKYNLRPSKKYGQNYLIDQEVIERMLEVGGVTKKDTVVEVGPGFGVLTLPLAEKAHKVFSFEIEKKLQGYWQEQLEKYKNLQIVWGNVLKEFPNYQLSAGSYKLIANLPYQITSPVIRTFLESVNPPTALALMVQKEVAERIAAKPGNMSLLSLAVQYYADAEVAFIVPRTAFWPSPQVDSAVIKIKMNPVKRDLAFEERLFKVARSGFAQKRKLLVKNLEPVVGRKNKKELLAIFDTLGLLPTARAQELSVDQWKKLVEYIGEIKN